MENAKRKSTKKYELLDEFNGAKKVIFSRKDNKQKQVFLSTDMGDHEIRSLVADGLSPDYFVDHTEKEAMHLETIFAKGIRLHETNIKPKVTKTELVIIKQGSGMTAPMVDKSAQRKLAVMAVAEAVAESTGGAADLAWAKSVFEPGFSFDNLDKEVLAGLRVGLGLTNNAKVATIKLKVAEYTA